MNKKIKQVCRRCEGLGIRQDPKTRKISACPACKGMGYKWVRDLGSRL